MDPKNEGGGTPAPQGEDGPSVDKIQQLLRSKDDTSRFVGLALLKSILDSSDSLRGDAQAVTELWDSISAKFLDRLLRTGSQPAARGDQNSRDMLDLAVAVLHTFTVLLPEDARREVKLLGRIPRLAKAVLHSTKETTTVIVQTLASLAVLPEGARIIAGLELDDWAPLIEVAPEQPHVLTIFLWAWEQGTVGVEDERMCREKIDQGIQSFISSFIGTDAASLLEFVSHILRSLQATLIPEDPTWLPSLTKLIRNLSTGRPVAAARSAYTNCAGALLLVYPATAPRLLFADEPGSSKPFAYLFISLILVDIRATLPSLLEKLNEPDYPLTSQRLTSAFDILASFIGQLIAWLESMDDDDVSSSSGNGNKQQAAGVLSTSSASLNMPPDLVLKLSKSIGETLSVTMEFLRDRWDAAVAGAQGLHPSARTGAAHTAAGSRMTLAWDAAASTGAPSSSSSCPSAQSQQQQQKQQQDLQSYNAAADPLTLSSIRAIALWLKDDDGDALREEASGLMDMFIELYRSSGSNSSSSSSETTSSRGPAQPDFRLPILAALEGVLRVPNGVDAFVAHDGWSALSRDLAGILSATSSSSSSNNNNNNNSNNNTAIISVTEADLIRGSRIPLVLTILLEGGEGEEGGGGTGLHSETWMDLVTAVAAYSMPDHASGNGSRSLLLAEFQTDVLRLAALLLRVAPPAIRRRYAHSAGAVRGVAEQVMRSGRLGGGGGENEKALAMVKEELVEVIAQLSEL